MNVADVMTPRSAVITADLPGGREDVLAYLQEQEFSSVPVLKETGDGEQYRGLVSREDLIEQPDEDQLALLMREVPTLARDASIADLARLVVEEDARRVPVVEDGRLEGIVTITDAVRAIAEGEEDGDTPVGDVATENVNTTYTGTPLQVAERELGYANVPYAVVLDDDAEMAGMLTEVDLIAVAEVVEGEESTGESIAGEDDDWMWEGIKAVGARYTPTRNVELPREPVAEYMTADLVTVTRRRTVREAAQLMIQHDIEQIPLVTGDELTGIVRDRDLMTALL